jgi:nicotinate-nucleotide adenylyltransferase
MRIGLLGGSFNPAHQGHRHVIDLARRRLRLDQVWLLVSPGNPLKPRHGMAPFDRRLASARGIADGRRVIASAIEAVFGTRYTIDTLRRLLCQFPRVRFVWLMGADILEQLPRWRRWLEFVRHVPFAVLPRPGFNHRALSSPAVYRFARARRPGRSAAVLSVQAAPAWIFLHVSQHGASASAIRAREGAQP